MTGQHPMLNNQFYADTKAVGLTDLNTGQDHALNYQFCAVTKAVGLTDLNTGQRPVL